MPDPFEPMEHNAGEPRRAGRPHLDAGTIALLADVELDHDSVSELARFLLEDDPVLPIDWQEAGLLQAVEHLRGCVECMAARAAVPPAAAAALVIEVNPAHAARLDMQIAAALAALDERDERSARSARSARSSGWRAWFGGRSSTGGPSGSASPAAGGTSWAFSRDRRVLMALAVMLAIAVPFLVGTARTHRPNAAKVATVAKATTTLDTTDSSDSERVGGGSSGAGDNSAETTAAAAEIAPEAAAGALSAPVSDPPVPFDAQGANDTAPPAPPGPTVALVAAPSPSAVSTAAPAPAHSSPAAAKKSTASVTPAPPVASASSGAASEAGPVSDGPNANGFDLGNLGSFPDDDAALAAFGRAGDGVPATARAAATTAALTPTAAADAIAPSTAAPTPPTSTPSGPAVAAAAAAPESGGGSTVPPVTVPPVTPVPTTIPSTRPPSAAFAACANALRGADRFALAEIGGAATIVASFATPPPGHIQLIAVDGCVVRRDRPR